MTYESTLEYLYNQLPTYQHIGSSAYKPGLDNTIQLLKVLENPHTKFKAIHVAGTNGKGSVSHFLASIFQSQGYKTGLYTSPHLVDFGERIKVNGMMIERDYVVNFVEQNIDTFHTIQPSFFEATMSMAFNYFAEQQVDIAIVEVGLGGRLDSTNVISPLISVITNISFDHMNLLGNTLAQIASEKAGIIKMHTPVVIGELQQETISVFRAKAIEMDSQLFVADDEFTLLESSGSKMVVVDKKFNRFKLGLTGTYQLKNLATVLKTIEIINQSDSIPFQISKKALADGLENVVENTGLRGRWEILSNQPLTISDTGHNMAGIEFVVKQLGKTPHRKLHFVIGMVNDKDLTHVLELLPPQAEYYFTQANIVRALAATELQKFAENYNLIGNSFQTVEAAVKNAQSNANADDIIFIGGSNFVVGEALILFKSLGFERFGI